MRGEDGGWMRGMRAQTTLRDLAQDAMLGSQGPVNCLWRVERVPDTLRILVQMPRILFSCFDSTSTLI